MLKTCPNAACECHSSTPKGWKVKIGYYKPKSTNRKVPRYKCKSCGKTFSTHTDKPGKGQKKPHINDELFKLLVSGVSLRRSAKILGVKYDTVLRRLSYLAELAQKAHAERLKEIKTSFVQVDELETFVHAKAKALSVPMAVRVKTGEILGFDVARMPSVGMLAQVGIAKYGWHLDERPVKFQSMIGRIKGSLKAKPTFKCDGHKSYPKWIGNQIADFDLEQAVMKKRKKSEIVAKEYDELFAINNLFAKMRHDMNRLTRKTWSTTKGAKGLENHIWLYVAWNNGYELR